MRRSRAEIPASDGLLAATLQALVENGYRFEVDAVVSARRATPIAHLLKSGYELETRSGSRIGVQSSSLTQSGKMAPPAVLRAGEGRVVLKVAEGQPSSGTSAVRISTPFSLMRRLSSMRMPPKLSIPSTMSHATSS